MKYIFEFLFAGFIVVVADVQATIIYDGRKIKHGWWGLLFAVVIAFSWILEEYNLWFLSALIIEHFLFFSPVLNLFRRPQMPFFYLSKTSGSLWDKVVFPIAYVYPYIWIIALLSFILIQFEL